MYAVIETGGKQYRVEVGTELEVELLDVEPGKTVTIIPVSSGPSVEADPGDSWVPSEPQRGVILGAGGTCRRRGGGGGIGIAARFPVGAFSPRLR